MEDTDDMLCVECEGDHSSMLPVSAPISFDTHKKSYRGTIVVGRNLEGNPAMRTFQPDGTDQLFWIDTDKSPEVASYIERVIKNDQVTSTPYKPRRITLNGYFQPPPRKGILSKLDGIFIAKGMY